MEILAPTKNFETAKVAIQNGADALYLASPSFGARTNASMDIEEITKIVDYANRYLVKTFITFNTVIFDNELEKMFAEIDQIYQIGASGVIIQDFAFIELLAKAYPDLEIHCSTQMHVHNTDAVSYVKQSGACRSVVPREMTFDRIRKIKDNVDIDIECFIHGAICVSYSGQCYDSTLLDQKSANRGRCSQYCRMPQHIKNTRTGVTVSNGRYPLNLKDMNNLDNVDRYMLAGVDSLKIEGRLKAFDYVGYTTSAYRQQVDYLTGLREEKPDITSDDLTRVYNRTFTTGRIDSKNGSDLVNLTKPNNTGRLIGEVKSCMYNHDRQLGFYKYEVTIISDEEIHLQDNIRFLTDKYEDGQNVEKIVKVEGNKITILSNCQPPEKALVYRTQENAIIEAQGQLINKLVRREMIDLSLKVVDNEIHYQLYDDKLIASGLSFETANNAPLTKEKFLKKLLKTNDTPYTFNLVEFDYTEDGFMPMGKIGELKTMIIDYIDSTRQIKRQSNQVQFERIAHEQSAKESKYFIEVRTVEQYETIKQYPQFQVLIGDYRICDEIDFDDTDYLVLPRINYDDEFPELDKYADRYSNLVASELGSLIRYQDKIKATNFTLNTTNALSQDKLINMGVDKTLLSIELNFDKLARMANDHALVNIYGRVPVMIMDYCPINKLKQDTCGSCRRCHTGQYILEDEYDRVFPLMYEGNARIGMYSKQAVNLLDKQEELHSVGINNYHLRFTNETASECESVVDALINDTELKGSYSSGSYYKETL